MAHETISAQGTAALREAHQALARRTAEGGNVPEAFKGDPTFAELTAALRQGRTGE